MNQIEERSSQLVRNLSSCEKNLRKFRLERSSLNIFQAFFSQLLKLRTNCEDLSSIGSFFRSSKYICFIYLHSWIDESLSNFKFWLRRTENKARYQNYQTTVF